MRNRAGSCRRLTPDALRLTLHSEGGQGCIAPGARTTTGELVLLDSGLHLGSAMRAVVPPAPPRN